MMAITVRDNDSKAGVSTRHNHNYRTDEGLDRGDSFKQGICNRSIYQLNDEGSLCIVAVPLWEQCREYMMSAVFGLWVICKLLAKYAWDSNAFGTIRHRECPPACLVDATLGQHKYVKLKGTKYHFVERGDRHLPLLLLLHGFPDCWFGWRHQMLTFSQWFRVVAVDLKGFGDSDKPAGLSQYRLNIILGELRLLIGSLGVSRCIVMGHDLGGFLGWCLAHEWPQMVAKLIVISCPHPKEYKRNLSATYNFSWSRFVQLPYLPEIDALKDDVRLIQDYHSHLKPHDDHLEAYKYSFSRKEDWTGALNYYRNLPYYQLRGNGAIMDVSVFLITGNRDKLIRLESIVRSTDYCAHKFQVKIVEGAGHFPHQEKPKQFNDIILKLLVKSVNRSARLGSGLAASTSGTSTESMDVSTKATGIGANLWNRMSGAVSSTVKYGNEVIDHIQRRTINNAASGILSYGTLNRGRSVSEQSCVTQAND